MAGLWARTLSTYTDASGAAAAAREGRVVVIIDVVDMSTTAEAALEVGAREVLGASPDSAGPPVPVNPEKIGYYAGREAGRNGCEIVVAAEPRLPTKSGDERRRGSMNKFMRGIRRAGMQVADVVPNLGREVTELVDFAGKILVIISSSGGVAFDAAFNFFAPAVITGTVARTGEMSGSQPANAAAERAVSTATSHGCGIALVAASSNSPEDLMAADYIQKKIIDHGFLEQRR